MRQKVGVRFLPVLAVCLAIGVSAHGQTLQQVVDSVSQSQYTYYLAEPNLLYTHAGNTRASGTAQHDAARTNIYNQFAGLGLSTSLFSFTRSGGTYYNVVGVQTGRLYPDQIYVLGAHYDSVSAGAGADDDASGVAGVMEAARVLSRYDSNATIVYVAFDREESGLWGSWAYAADANDHNDDIRGMISLDMIAYNLNGANAADIYGRTEANSLKYALKSACQTYGGISVQVGGPTSNSDHYPFGQHGFNSCILIEDWGNPYYHTANDNVDVSGYIDYAYATKMTRGVVGWVAEAAGVFPDPITKWNALSGNWSDANGWTAEEPNAAIRASISNGGAVTISGPGRSCSVLFLGRAGSQSGTVNMTGGALDCNAVYVGYAGGGTFQQNGGTHRVSGLLAIGYSPDANGTYSLEGGYLLAGEIVVGGSSTEKGGTGTFDICGGNASVDGKLIIWDGSEAHLGSGTLVGSDGNHPCVDVENSGTLYIEDGVYCLGRLTGIGDTWTGTTVVQSGATLWVESLVQDSLVIEAGAEVHFAGENYELFMALARQNQQLVPEPATLVLLGLGAVALLRRRR